MLLYSETPNLHTHTLKIAVIDASGYHGDEGGRYGFEAFRRTVARRLHLLEPLRYRLVDIPMRLHHPMWMKDCPVDLDYHLRRVRVPSPGGRRELDEVIGGEIASTPPLDRSRPLWEFYFAEGDGRRPLRADRQGAPHPGRRRRLGQSACAPDGSVRGGPQDERDEPPTPCDPPSSGQLLWEAQVDHLQNMAALPHLMADAARGGFTRLRKRSRERRADRTSPGRSTPHPPFSTTSSPPFARSRPRRCHSRRSRRPVSTSR